MFQEFLSGIPYPDDSTDAGLSAGVRNGQYLFRLNQEGAWRSVLPVQSEGRDFSYQAQIASMTGSGAFMLLLESDAEDWSWRFFVSQDLMQWWVDVDSPPSASYFEWIRPQSFAWLRTGRVERVELRVIEDTPILLINGIDVVTPEGIQLKKIPRNVSFGFGVSGAADFEVAIDGIYVVQLD